MHQAHTSICAIQVAPIGHTCNRRCGSSNDAQRHGDVCSTSNACRLIVEPGEIKQHRTAPGSNGYIGEHGVQSMSKPCPIQYVLDPAIGLFRLTIELQKPVLKRSSQFIQPGLALNNPGYSVTEWGIHWWRFGPTFLFSLRYFCGHCWCSFLIQC